MAKIAAQMAQRILLIRLSAIGDVVNTLPAVSLLRAALPDAFLGYAVEDRARDVVAGHPLLDEVFVFPRRRWRELLLRPSPRGWVALRREVRDFARALRARRFEVALDFQSNLKGAAHAIASGAPRRVGFARGYDYEMNHWLTTEQVTPPGRDIHRVVKFASLLSALGVDASRPGPYVLPPASAAARERVDAFLGAAGIAARLAAGQPLVLVHPGTSDHGAEKRWPPERFAEAARRIAAEEGTPVVVTWGPGERDLASAVQRSAASDDVVLGPETAALGDLIELIRRTSVFVSSDTGPMHLAAATGAACVALFGPKDPRVYGPFGEGHVVVHRDARDGAPGMQRIAVDDVVEAAAACLERARREGRAVAGDRRPG